MINNNATKDKTKKGEEVVAALLTVVESSRVEKGEEGGWDASAHFAYFALLCSIRRRSPAAPTLPSAFHLLLSICQK